MLVKLVEVYTSGTYSDNGNIKPKYCLRETYANPDHVVCMREESTLAPTIINEELDPRQGFTKLHINRGQAGIDITVVGSLNVIEEKLQKSLKSKKMLHG